MIVLENLKMPLCGLNRKIFKKIRERFESSESWILRGLKGAFSEWNRKIFKKIEHVTCCPQLPRSTYCKFKYTHVSVDVRIHAAVVII